MTSLPHSLSLGIDIGGTFTDLVLRNANDQRSGELKVLTTHSDPVKGICEGVRQLLSETGLPAQNITRVVHATTLFTNALIERKGAKIGLITTEGFRDVVHIGRERRYDLYDLRLTPPAPLVSQELRMEVPERVKADGTVLRALDVAALDARVTEARAQGIEALAILFLHSDLYPAHEAQAVQHIAARFPDLLVSASHAIVREVREYDRGSTVTANAYIAPLAEHYLARLGTELRNLGIKSPLLLMMSSGGLTHLEEARRAPVQLLESGPAAGALAAGFLAGPDEAHVLAFDLGGTTAKLCVVEHGEPAVVFGFEAARQSRFIEGSGLPIRISTVDLMEIGAGGGSIARRDTIGLLKVGPDSAGSEPGAACYGLGGIHPTVTDANLLLGYLDPERFADGRIRLDRDAALKAIGGLAEALGISAHDTAWGIHDIATEAMAGAARTHLAERGRDASEFALVCTGGGGPVHGYHLAQKLGIRKLIVPPQAGVASALGLLTAPPRVDRVVTLGRPLGSWKAVELEAAFAALEADARAVLVSGGWSDHTLMAERLVDARCIGQGSHMAVRLPPGPWRGDDESVRSIFGEAFKHTYVERFRRPPPRVPVDLVHARITLRGKEGLVHFSVTRQKAKGEVPLRRREVRFGPSSVVAAVYSRAHLPCGFEHEGPGLVEEAGSTLVVGPRGRFRIVESGNIVVEVG